MIRFACGTCKERLVVPDRHVMRKGKCPKCGTVNRIPAVSEFEEPAPPTVAAPAMPIGPATAGLMPAPEVVSMRVVAPPVSAPPTQPPSVARPLIEAPPIAVMPRAVDGPPVGLAAALAAAATEATASPPAADAPARRMRAPEPSGVTRPSPSPPPPPVVAVPDTPAAYVRVNPLADAGGMPSWLKLLIVLGVLALIVLGVWVVFYLLIWSQIRIRA